MFSNLEKYRIILASQSPRRRELLSQLGLCFEVQALLNVSEDYPRGLGCEDIAKFIASKKAEHYRPMMSARDLLITADTIVCVDDMVLGKPKDKDDAVSMLQRLSGRSHEVITGFTVSTTKRFECESAITTVEFAPLTEEMILYYVEHYRPFDKAGAYGIQEWIGSVGVRGINGSFFNVVGLPVQRLSEVLLKF